MHGWYSLKRDDTACEPGVKYQIAILPNIGADIEHDLGAGPSQDLLQYLVLDMGVLEALDLQAQFAQDALNEDFDG
jgi:hypothetical protein